MKRICCFDVDLKLHGKSVLDQLNEFFNAQSMREIISIETCECGIRAWYWERL